MKKIPATNVPVEVAMVDKVKECRDCQWFWGGIPPYGPFPGFDWEEMYPQAIKDGPPAPAPGEERKPVEWCEVQQQQAPRVEPAVLRGCRKAPIMTVGINPNMTAFFAGAVSTTWAYPYFEHRETYAYYYRHADIYQESLSPKALVDCIIPGTEIKAEHDGRVFIQRSDTHRWLSMVFEYDVDGKIVTDKKEFAWLPQQRLVVFAGGGDREFQMYYFPDGSPGGLAQGVEGNDSGNVETNNIEADGVEAINEAVPLSLESALEIHQQGELSGGLWAGLPVKRGETVAANIEQKSGPKVTLFANVTGYYQRLNPVLESFNQYLQKQGFNDCELRMGEDVSMHDMVACASPGWGTRYNIPTTWIADACVKKNRFALDQLLQSRPRLLFIVSTSSLEMFADGIEHIGGNIELDWWQRDAFDLLKETSSKVCRLVINDTIGGHKFSTRIVVTPHFSYKDNFQQQSRFDVRTWQQFVDDFKADADILSDNGRIDDSNQGKVAVYVDANNDPLQTQLSASAWQVLMRFHINPYQLITDVVIEEHEKSPFISKPQAKHLDRAEGDCKFCVNELWRFPEGCEYGIA